MRDEVMSRASTAVVQAAQYRDSYNEHSYLWSDDRKEFLEQFLKYGHVLTQVCIEREERSCANMHIRSYIFLLKRATYSVATFLLICTYITVFIMYLNS